MQEKKVFVVGVGMTKFKKPTSDADWAYPDMVKEAVELALNDSDLKFESITAAYVGYVYGDSTSGQRSLYDIGMTGIPIINVNNNCSTGSTALMMAKLHIEANGGCVLAVGFEKMDSGPLTSKFADRTNPMERHMGALMEQNGWEPNVPFIAQLFGNAAREHMLMFNSKPEHFAKIAEKNHRHSKNNPNAQLQNVYTLKEILSSPMIFPPLTKLQCCPTSCGAAAAILCDESFVLRCGLQSQAVEILGMEMTTDLRNSFTAGARSLVGYDMTVLAASRLYRRTGLQPSDVQVIELHDCFSANELITYEALGLCPVGGAAQFIDAGDNTYGGRFVVNPSGGLISKGHPLGATGLAQCFELCLQLRGLAGLRQVNGARIALQHNLGIGGAVVVALYRKGFSECSIVPNKSSAATLIPTLLCKL